jgi:DNA/RNA endonuclease YhcR with UshA esterase domain
MSHCPSCGQPVEGGHTCPRCGASLTARLPLQILRYGALVIALGGVLALLYAARGTPVPRLRIGEIAAAQNLAYVEISGTVSQPPDYDPETQSLSFRVDDGSGDLLVSVFRDETTALARLGRVPAVGDRVTVQGTLRVREDFTGLILNAADALSLERPTPLPMVIGAINADTQYQAVVLTARVIRIRSPYPALTLITLQDPTGQMDAALDEATRLLTGDPPALAPGDVVRLSGVVTLFKGEPQIALASSTAIELLPSDAALENFLIAPEEVAPIASVRVGAVARVEGTVIAVESLPAAFTFTLSDDSGALTLYLRDEVYPGVDGVEGLRLGARVQAVGLVESFEGKMQITPDSAEDVTLLAPAPPPQTLTAIRDIGLAQVGQTATIVGKIVASADFSNGIRLSVDDGAGVIIVLLWDNVLTYAPAREQLSPGQAVQVTGTISQFQGALEIAPQIGFDVIVNP